MIGSVKLKSKSWAFSISTASDGGAMESDAAAMIAEREFGLVKILWGFGKFANGNLGNEIWIGETLIFGGGVAEEEEQEVIRALDEAMITLAIAATLLLLLLVDFWTPEEKWITSFFNGLVENEGKRKISQRLSLPMPHNFCLWDSGEILLFSDLLLLVRASHVMALDNYIACIVPYAVKVIR